MSEWVTEQLSQLVTFQKGRKVDTSPYPTSGFDNYLGAGALSGRSDGYASTFLAVIADTNDVLMLWDGERSGLVGHNLSGVVSSTVSKLTPNGKVGATLLYYYLLLNFEWIQNRRTGTGVPHVPKNIGRILRVRYPINLQRQEKVAYILQTIDQAIEKTEALIEKYQQIKAGLMHDLFTRGIGPDGKLRPPREQAPELYQQTPIGWIPREWALRTCTDICLRISVGIVIQPSQYYVDEGVPAFRSANVREVGIDSANLVYISPLSNALLAKSQVKAGDILSVRTGYPGTSAVVPPEYEGSNCIDVLISTPGDEVLSDYLCNWINSPFGKGQVLRQQGGMAQQHFNVAEMKELLVALPSVNEQEEISKRLMVFSSNISLEKNKKNKLLKQKSGLMYDLLTGKTEVKVEQSGVDDVA